jgi:transcriptional regulator with XRE-family HTH domain
MKPVGNKLKTLRGKLNLDQFEAAHRAHVSRETIRKAEEGIGIKLKSVKQIARALGASEADIDDLICDWLRAHAGVDAGRISIAPKAKSQLREVAQTLPKQIASSSANLTLTEQESILLALGRPEVVRFIADLNAFYESISKTHQKI